MAPRNNAAFNWVRLALMRFYATRDEAARMRDLYRFVDELYDDPNQLSAALSEQAGQGIIGRFPVDIEDGATNCPANAYYPTPATRETVRSVGLPTAFPNGDPLPAAWGTLTLPPESAVVDVDAGDDLPPVSALADRAPEYMERASTSEATRMTFSPPTPPTVDWGAYTPAVRPVVPTADETLPAAITRVVPPMPEGTPVVTPTARADGGVTADTGTSDVAVAEVCGRCRDTYQTRLSLEAGASIDHDGRVCIDPTVDGLDVFLHD
jgi:hypothetical protein